MFLLSSSEGFLKGSEGFYEPLLPFFCNNFQHVNKNSEGSEGFLRVKKVTIYR